MATPANAGSRRSVLPLLLSAFFGLAVGTVLGGAAASGVFLVVMNWQGGNEEAQVLALGNTFVQNLAMDKVTTAYLSTSASYQEETDRQAFDELVRKMSRHPGIVCDRGLRE